MAELLLEDADAYRRFLRMDVASFEFILGKVKPMIEKNGEIWRVFLLSWYFWRVFAVFSLADFSPSLLKNSLNEFVGLADLVQDEFLIGPRELHTRNELQNADVSSFSRTSGKRDCQNRWMCAALKHSVSL